VSFSSAAVRRPVFTAMVTLIVVVLGVVALARLKLDLLPDIELPTLSIRTEYDGASPEVIEQRVTEIIEEVVATVPGVEDLESISAEGLSEIRVTFAWGTDIETAAIEMRARLEDEMSELPPTVVRPQIRTFDAASFPIVVLGISSHLDPVELTTLVDEQIRYRFSRITGVAQVDPWGEYERELRVEVDPKRLSALRISLPTVVDALTNANMDLPAGELADGNDAITLRAPAQFGSPEQVGEVIVAVRDGAAIRLRQVAKVRDTYRKLQRLARVNGKLGLRLGIRKQSDANTVEVAQRVLSELEEIRRDYPHVDIVPVINQGDFIQRSIANVAQSVLYGGGLAIAVLLVFLRSVRSTIVIAVSIPLALVSTFVLMHFWGLTLNLMTLGGLALGIGMMVDNSIVVLENIFRRRDELHEPIMEAVLRGVADVSAAITASTVTTLVIFLPLVFVQGVAGQLFRDLALVIAFSLGCSLIVALTLVPVLSSLLLRERRMPREGSLSERAGQLLVNLEAAYGRVLRGALGRPIAVILGSSLALAASLLLIPQIGTDFLPPSDEGEVRVIAELPVGTHIDVVDRQTRLVESYVYPAVPEIVSSVVSIGASPRNPQDASNGELELTLSPAGERTRSSGRIAADLRAVLAGKIPGAEVRTRAPEGQFLLNRILGTEEGLSIEVRGFDLATLAALAGEVSVAVQGVRGITDVELSREEGVPQERFHIDRDKAAQLGLSVGDIARTLETAVAGSPAGEYRVRGNAYRILVQLSDIEQRPLADVLDLPLETQHGVFVPLRGVVTTERAEGPLVIERKDQQRIIKVHANVAGRDMGSVAAEIQARLGEIVRPPGYDLRVAGTYEEQQRAFSELVISLGLALLLVYMVLAAQYESLRDPFVVMLSVPVSAIGVLVVLALTHTTFNVQSYIGCIMLGGIVVNNAILLVDQARTLGTDGMPWLDAIAEAGRLRLRPILMTTLTTVLALLPLALGFGEGADAQAPLARTVLGGLTVSTVITLVLVPVVYSLAHGGKVVGPSDPSRA